jgi:hypothetical protein
MSKTISFGNSVSRERKLNKREVIAEVLEPDFELRRCSWLLALPAWSLGLPSLRPLGLDFEL